MKLIQEEWKSAKRLINEALTEDRAQEDVTTRLLIPSGVKARAVIRAKEAGLLSGVEIAKAVFLKLNPKLKIQLNCQDGKSIKRNETVLTIQGNLAPIVSAERTALNFLGHLSGIATLTHEFVKKVEPHQVKVMDTRKTTPGLRLLEKYAVRCGGGVNHRSSLADAVFIKDNHWKFLQAASGKPQATSRFKKEMIIEVENEGQLHEALKWQPDVLLFDNQSPKSLKRFCSKVRSLKLKPQPELEVSGGITLQNVKAYAAAGVDRISVGALTHSAKSLNFSLEIA